jgi:hypothetical protein
MNCSSVASHRNMYVPSRGGARCHRRLYAETDRTNRHGTSVLITIAFTQLTAGIILLSSLPWWAALLQVNDKDRRRRVKSLASRGERDRAGFRPRPLLEYCEIDQRPAAVASARMTH